MTLFPVIGYSTAELQAEYQRGLSEGQLRCRQALQETLQQLMPTVAHRLAQSYPPSLTMMIQQLTEAWSVEIDQRRQAQARLETENRQLQAKVNGLEKKWGETRPDELRSRISTMITEQLALQDQMNQLLAESLDAQCAHAAQTEALQAEIKRLEDLVVKYEHQSRPQNTKH